MKKGFHPDIKRVKTWPRVPATTHRINQESSSTAAGSTPGDTSGPPFVIKLEARLRFAGVAYKAEVGSTRSAPNGKIPYIEIFNDGGKTAMGDSTLITKELVERGVMGDLNGGLSGEEKARDLAFRAILEEKLYFMHVSCLSIP